MAALRSFEAAARLGRFHDAAAELGVTPAAISHAVRQLERELDCRLFVRQTRAVSLTDIGRRLFEGVERGFDMLETSLSELARRDRGTTITTTRAFGARWLVPRLSSLQRAHPDIALKLLASDAVMRLNTAEVDLAVRYVPADAGHDDAPLVFTDWYSPVCSPSLGISNVRDLLSAKLIEVPWIHASHPAPTWQRWAAAADVDWPARTPDMVFSDDTHAIQAALAGQGVLIASLPLVEDEIRRGLLVRPFDCALQGADYRILLSVRPTPDALTIRDWILNEAGR